MIFLKPTLTLMAMLCAVLLADLLADVAFGVQVECRGVTLLEARGNRACPRHGDGAADRFHRQPRRANTKLSVGRKLVPTEGFPRARRRCPRDRAGWSLCLRDIQVTEGGGNKRLAPKGGAHHCSVQACLCSSVGRQVAARREAEIVLKSHGDEVEIQARRPGAAAIPSVRARALLIRANS